MSIKTLFRLILSATVALFGLNVSPAETKLPTRPTKLINTSCDINEQEIAAQGQAVCRYICRDTDKTKIAVVFSNSGMSQCRSPIDRTIKVVIK